VGDHAVVREAVGLDRQRREVELVVVADGLELRLPPDQRAGRPRPQPLEGVRLADAQLPARLL